ncbi:ROK family protein [Algoriphagus namhaensis]
MKRAIGIDIGGTNIKGVLIDEHGAILHQEHWATQGEQDGVWQQNAKSVFEKILGHHQNTHEQGLSVGLSAPGLADASNTCIAFLPHRLPGLENFDWTSFFGFKTTVLNDAHAALMAEASFGAMKGMKNAVLLTLGTGVGGGLLLDGKLHQGLGQMAGHIGHTAIRAASDDLSILGIPGSLEYALGNYSIEKRSHGIFKTTYELLDAYHRKETFATWMWLDMMRTLSLGICSLINTFSPEAVVLAGGMTHAGDALFKPLNDFVAQYEFRPNGKQTKLLKARFEDYSGAIGAAAFALQNQTNLKEN